MNYKVCSKYQEELPATEEFFYRKKSGKYGLNSWCKICHCNHGRICPKRIVIKKNEILGFNPNLEESP